MLFTVESLSSLATGSSLPGNMLLQYSALAKTRSYFTCSCTFGLNSPARVMFQ